MEFLNRKSEGDVTKNTNDKTKTITNEEQHQESDEGATADEAVIHADERCNNIRNQTMVLQRMRR